MRFFGILALGLAAVAASAQEAPPAPDYADAANWSQAGTALPGGATPSARRPKVDVFYIYPTTERNQPLWNQDVRDAESNRWTDESAIARQASAFTAAGRVFAPRYRSATLKALRDNSQRDAAYDLAFTDVERAFDHFLKGNGNRPFIIAGHSQGALHAARLIERRVQGTPLQRRLVAGYIIGLNLSEGEFGTRFTLPLCAQPTETGCILQWNALLEGSDITAAATASSRTYADRHGDGPGRITACINPISFSRAAPASPASDARGAVPGDPGFGAMQPLRARAVAARCEQGMLVVSPDAALGLKPLPGGSMHYHDVGLFWADVRANAAARAKAFRSGR